MEAVFWLLDFSTHPLSSGGYLPPPSPVFVYRRRYRFLSTVAVTGYPLPLPFPVLLVRCLFRLQMNLRIFNGCNRSRSLKGGWIIGPWTLYRSLAQVIRSLSPLKIGYKYRKLAVQTIKSKKSWLLLGILDYISNMRPSNKCKHGSSYKYRKTSFSKPQIKKTRLLLDQT